MRPLNRGEVLHTTHIDISYLTGKCGRTVHPLNAHQIHKFLIEHAHLAGSVAAAIARLELIPDALPTGHLHAQREALEDLVGPFGGRAGGGQLTTLRDCEEVIHRLHSMLSGPDDTGLGRFGGLKTAESCHQR